ncbi:ketoacyl-synthetase C-terminal extension domain-containing protein, partial [Streptomyces sp. KL109B]|uniref:ketoacyl-synthetase C-terminal extension domain-containing protein n=1 Tax=Streptomyces sp. KL109B TaxID=3045155 RepID=UPI00278C665F
MSAFGISGTNAHLILEQAPSAEPVAVTEPVGPVGWVLSARNEGTLRTHAGRIAEAATDTDLPVQDVAATLAARTVFDHRGIVLGTTRQELLAGLNSLAQGTPSDTVVTGTAKPGKTVLVFPGQGSQWSAMARELH